MTGSYSVTDTATFTRTHAVHIAAKVVTDLKRMQRFYGKPSDKLIQYFETEAVELLRAGYMSTIIYGFQKNDCWIEPTLFYTVYDLSGATVGDDDPGLIRPRSLPNDASFGSYLTCSYTWNHLSMEQRKEFIRQFLYNRSTGPELDVSGHWSNDRTYSAGDRALDRASLRYNM